MNPVAQVQATPCIPCRTDNHAHVRARIGPYLICRCLLCPVLVVAVGPAASAAEVAARQLAADPEFREWAEDERAAEQGVLMRRAMR